ncbi:hypothetical protein NKG05_09770 [Oerskovia sp. M15]
MNAGDQSSRRPDGSHGSRVVSGPGRDRHGTLVRRRPLVRAHPPVALPTSTQRLPLGVGTLGGDALRTTAPAVEATSGTPFAGVRPSAEERPATYAPASSVRALPPVPAPPSPSPAGPTAQRSRARSSTSRRGRLSGPALWIGCAVLVVAVAGSGSPSPPGGRARTSRRGGTLALF